MATQDNQQSPFCKCGRRISASDGKRCPACGEDVSHILAVLAGAAGVGLGSLAVKFRGQIWTAAKFVGTVIRKVVLRA